MHVALDGEVGIFSLGHFAHSAYLTLRNTTILSVLAQFHRMFPRLLTSIIAPYLETLQESVSI